MRVAFHSPCGCGNLGHRARFTAIERALARRGSDVEFGPYSPDALPDLVVVDLVWWRPLPVAPEMWLLARAERRGWSGFDPDRWARVISIEPGMAGPFTDEVAPVVMVNPDEVAPGPFDGRTVVMHGGSASEVARLSEMAGPGAVVITGEPWPAARFLPSAAHVYAGGGYNATWEARWLGYAERTTFVPFHRGNDDQAARIAETMPMTENGADVLAGWLM